MTKSANMTRLWNIMDALDDPENNDNQRRADLIDDAIGLSDADPECAAAWKAYR